MADGSGEVHEFVSADVGSDGLGKPTAQVVDNGRVLEIVAEIKDNRHKTTDCYDKAITEYKTILKAAAASLVEEIEAEKKIDMLKARRTAHAKYMKTMKSEKQANWSRQVFRIPLPCEVESKLVNREHKGDNVKGMVFMIDMKKKSDMEEYVGAVAAPTPEK